MKIPDPRSVRNWFIGGLLVMPIVYVLSLGPVVRWWSEQEDDIEVSVFLGGVYAPLMWLVDAPVIGFPLQVYCEIWMVPDMAWEMWGVGFREGGSFQFAKHLVEPVIAHRFPLPLGV